MKNIEEEYNKLIKFAEKLLEFTKYLSKEQKEELQELSFVLKNLKRQRN